MHNLVVNTWYYGFDTTKQPCYQPVVDCIYWPVLGFFNNWNIIQYTNNTKSSEDFDEMNKVLLDGIRNNMAYLVWLGKYGAINAANPTKTGYYMIK